MRRALLPLLTLGLVLALLGSAASPQPGPPAREAPTDLTSLGRLLDGLGPRIDELVALANRDARWRRVTEYAAYQPSQYQDAKRPWRAKDVVELLWDPTAPTDLRQAALKATTSAAARAYDPDLVSEKKGTSRKPRNVFAIQKVVEHLSDDDVVTRALVHEWLKAMFGDQNAPAIRNYDPRNGTKTSWKSAEREWKKALQG